MTERPAMDRPLLDRLLRHNHWAMRRLIDRCRPLSEAHFAQRFEIGPGSLRETLIHIIGAMRRWADRIGDRPLRPSMEGENIPSRAADLAPLLEDAAEGLEAVAVRIAREGRLDEMMSGSFAGATYRFTRGTAIVHVLTHGAHHRAQCLNMLRRLGVTDLPELDAIEWELDHGGSGIAVR